MPFLPRQSPNRLLVPKSCCKKTFSYLITIPLWSPAEIVNHRLGLEPVWLGLKPSQIPQYLVSGSSEAQVLDVSWQKEFHGRQSGREEVALFRYGEHTPHRAGPSQRVGVPQSAARLVFTGWVSSHASQWEDCAKCSWEGQRSPGFGPPPTPWSFNSALELSWSLWLCHLTCCSRTKV